MPQTKCKLIYFFIFKYSKQVHCLKNVVYPDLETPFKVNNYDNDTTDK